MPDPRPLLQFSLLLRHGSRICVTPKQVTFILQNRSCIILLNAYGHAKEKTLSRGTSTCIRAHCIRVYNLDV